MLMVQLQYGVDESYRLSVPAPAPGKPAYAYLQVGEPNLRLLSLLDN